MKSMTRLAIAAVAAAGIIAGSLALADGDSRKATDAEKAFSKTVLDTISKALPAGPEGWEKGQTTEVKEATVIYSDPGQPFQINYTVSWQDSNKLMEASKAEAMEMQKLAKGPVENLTDKNIAEIVKKTAAHDAHLKITVDANVFSVSVYDKIAAGAPVAGGLVYRHESKTGNSGAWLEGTTYIFLGKGWSAKKSDATYFENKSAKRSSTEVQTILVKIQADPERAQQVIAKIDWEALKKLIKN